MKKLLLFTLLGSFVACAPKLNTEVLMKDKPNLIGKIDKAGLQSKTYAPWFNKNYDDYDVDTETVNAMKQQLKNYNITFFMGTWCGDSKREVPRLFRVLEAADYPMKQLNAIAVSRKKDTPDALEEGLNIMRVPTIIFFKDGKEVNRIIEYPVESLEKDMQKIVMQKAYTPNYHDLKKDN